MFADYWHHLGGADLFTEGNLVKVIGVQSAVNDLTRGKPRALFMALRRRS